MDVRRYKAGSIHRFHVFIVAVLLLKIVLMGAFSSDYQNALFMRFIHGFLTQAVRGNLVNPYEYFKHESGLFPYPPVMFAIECVGGTLSFFAGNSIFIKNILFKLPSLFFDCLGMHYLMVMFPQKRKYIALLYFASPITIYSTYMHGQLDIIPTTLLIGSLAYLTSSDRQDKKYILLLTMSLGSKFHICAVLPILLLFIAKRDGWLRSIVYMILPLLLVALCVSPFWGDGFIQNVLFNNEQSVLSKIAIDYVNVKIYVPIIAIMLVYLRTFTINRINRDLLYSLCGILFSVFLVLIPPMPGWYVWIVPFITVFFIDNSTNKYYNLAVYVALNILYLLYFLFAHRASYVDLYFLSESMAWIKIDNSLIVNGLFTLMTAVMIYSIYIMYKLGVESNSFYRRQNIPFSIGVAGDSGSGKSTFTEMVKLIFGEKKVLLIEGDGDHKWERGNAMWDHFTHLNPKANYLYRQAQDLSALKNGESVVRTDYDHDTGGFTEQHKIKPKPYLLLCGLHALYLPQVRNKLDLKIYMDVDETLRRYWKIQRDISSRGYDKQKILDQILARIKDAEKYVYPQKKYADLVISYFDKTLIDCMDSSHKVTLGLKMTLDIAIDLEILIQKIEYYGISVQYEYDETLTKQSIIIEGTGLEDRNIPIAAIANEVIPHMDEIINQPLEADDNLHGIMAIVLLLMISQKLKEG